MTETIKDFYVWGVKQLSDNDLTWLKIEKNFIEKCMLDHNIYNYSGLFKHGDESPKIRSKYNELKNIKKVSKIRFSMYMKSNIKIVSDI